MKERRKTNHRRAGGCNRQTRFLMVKRKFYNRNRSRFVPFFFSFSTLHNKSNRSLRNLPTRLHTMHQKRREKERERERERERESKVQQQTEATAHRDHADQRIDPIPQNGPSGVKQNPCKVRTGTARGLRFWARNPFLELQTLARPRYRLVTPNLTT